MESGRVRRCIAAFVVVTALGAAACSSSGDSKPVSARRRSDAALAHDVSPWLDRLGLQMQRLSVEARGGGPNPEHELSLYVQPALVETADVYAARFAPLTAAVVPAAFEKYDDIDWIDVCQERAGTAAGVDDAVPLTRIEVSRKDAATVHDWANFDLAALLALKLRAPYRVSVVTNDGVDQTRAWRTARTRAHTLDD
jgi:hypothetical protein